jgi:hypothetical protein
MDIQQIAQALKEENFPTEGEAAVALWQWSNRDVCPREAAETMRGLGYVPFEGYPLKRAELRPKWAHGNLALCE